MAEQEPKYEFRDGRVINRASGEAIPLDEPVFVFRARDFHAQAVLEEYARRVSDPGHAEAVLRRLGDFKRFRREHLERMKEPDTDAG